MIITETILNGAYIVDLEKIVDSRGFFSSVFTQDEFRKFNLETKFSQTYLSYSAKKATLRGMHYQVAPFEEVKLVRVVRGSIYDVIVDLRHDSPSYKQHFALELTAANYRAVYIPKNFAHGFITLSDNTEVLYQVSGPYSIQHSRGIRYNDPGFDFGWPVKAEVLSDRDKSFPDFP